MAEHEHLYPCPHCRKGFIWKDENPHRPFCSERCQLLDLSKWLNEEHRIPGETGMDEYQPQEDNEP